MSDLSGRVGSQIYFTGNEFAAVDIVYNLICFTCGLPHCSFNFSFYNSDVLAIVVAVSTVTYVRVAASSVDTARRVVDHRHLRSDMCMHIV